MDDLTVAEIAMEEVLAMAAKKWGPGATASIVYLGGPTVTVFERDAARAELAAHLLAEPLYVREEELPRDTTIAEVKRLREASMVQRGRWDERRAELEAVAYQYVYRVETPEIFSDAVANRHGHIRHRLTDWSSYRRGTGRCFEGHSWQEVVAKAELA